MSTGSIIDKQSLIEAVCEGCAGTCWGAKSICRIHNLHVGKITECPEWDKAIANQQGFKEKNGQLAFTDIKPALEWIQKTEEAIKGYRSMRNKANRIRKELDRVLVTSGHSNSGVAQYGDAASLPKGKGLKLSQLIIPEDEYERKVRRLKELESNIKDIDKAASTINNPQEKILIESLLDGEQMNITATIIGVSRTRAYEIRDVVICKMAWELYGTNEVA
ncbi:hypothetical protein [Brevibacillus nitrificans]|uniref:hypothetical protein n=1 Tax=Brevibacillus nitrificans TaxID=651560 RepID=UPI00285475C4|nr:hypothetical protein [Brevibacillus nitrificans]MDR7318896.1 hypothetical protein [Brevibacillus nitrificans]